MPANHQKPGERLGTHSPSQTSEGPSPNDTLLLDFWLLNNNFLLCKPVLGALF